MSGGVQKGNVQTSHLQTGLLGEDGDPPGPFQAVSIQKSILMIHPPQPLQLPSFVQHRFRKGGLPRIHMGQKAYANMLFQRVLWQMVHSGHLPSEYFGAMVCLCNPLRQKQFNIRIGSLSFLRIIVGGHMQKVKGVDIFCRSFL